LVCGGGGGAGVSVLLPQETRRPQSTTRQRLWQERKLVEVMISNGEDSRRHNASQPLNRAPEMGAGTPQVLHPQRPPLINTLLQQGV